MEPGCRFDRGSEGGRSSSLHCPEVQTQHFAFFKTAVRTSEYIHLNEHCHSPVSAAQNMTAVCRSLFTKSCCTAIKPKPYTKYNTAVREEHTKVGEYEDDLYRLIDFLLM